ncbi:MAG: quinol:electron acceptor oxidoreductase subunit ActD [Anaerolineales bacterium]
MSETTFLALFSDIDPAAEAIAHLKEIGVHEEQINVISGIPFTGPMLGRPHQWTNVPRLALAGAIVGFLAGLLLAGFTPQLYPIYTGRQPLVPIPPSLIVLFETTMLGMLLATFLGVFLDSYFPAYRPMEYVPEISDGKIAVLFRCTEEESAKWAEALKNLGAESVTAVEAVTL